MNSTIHLPNLPLWEPRFSRERLEELASDPTFDFDQGFKMNVIKPGDRDFPSFPLCISAGLKAEDSRKRMLPTAIGVDLSTTTRPGNAIVAVGVDPLLRRRYPSEVRNGSWKGPDIIKNLGEVCAMHPNLQFIMVENNGLQTLLLDMIEERKDEFPWWMKVEAFTTGTNKANPQYGVQSFETEFHNRAWSWPEGEWEGHKRGCVCSWCVCKGEFSRYPKAPTCDFIMATWFAKRAIDQWMWGPSTTSDAGELNSR